MRFAASFSLRWSLGVVWCLWPAAVERLVCRARAACGRPILVYSGSVPSLSSSIVQDIFPMDMRGFNWPEYTETWVLGIKKFMMNEDVTEQQLAKARSRAHLIMWGCASACPAAETAAHHKISTFLTASQDQNQSGWRFALKVAVTLLTQHLPSFERTAGGEDLPSGAHCLLPPSGLLWPPEGFGEGGCY